MAQEESILGAFGGFNQDDSLISPPGGQNNFEAGDYRYALNTRIGASSEDNSGGAENFVSTLAITNYYYWDGAAWVLNTAPAGTNTAIGKREDIDEGTIYWAVHNSNGDHQILKFVKSERKIYEMLKWSGLNFSATNIVSMARVSTYLVLTCRQDGDDGNVNPPRLINTSTIYSLKQTLGSSFSEYHISFAKWPPLSPPIFVDAFQVAYSGGNEMIRRGIFQFCYRYVYYGGLRSVWGPPTPFVSIENSDNATIPLVTALRIYIPGYIYDYETQSYFKHDSVEFYEVVEFIEFAFRRSTKDPWHFFRRMGTGDNGEDSKFIDFDNRGANTIVPTVDIGQYADTVPFASGACEVIDNRVMFADNDDDLLIEDFEVEDVEVYTDITPTWNGNISTGAYTGLSSAYKSLLLSKVNIMQYTFKDRGIYKLGIVFQHWSGRTSLVISPDNWTYLIPANNTFTAPTERFHALGFNIPAHINPPDWAVAYQIVRSNCINIEFFCHGIINDYIFLGVNPSAAFDATVTPQQAQDIINDYNNNLQNIGDDPMPLANRLSEYYRNETVVTTLASASRIYIDIRNWYLDSVATTGVSKPSNNIFYSFRKGDRVRFRGSESGSFSTLTVFDVPIVGFDGRGIYINKPSNLVTLKRRSVDAGFNDYIFTVEIYREKSFPSPNESVTPIEFFEMGEWYPVVNATTPSRDFEKRDFRWTGAGNVVTTPSSSSSGIQNIWFSKFPIVNGDVHWLTRTVYYKKVGSYPGESTGYYGQMNSDKDNSVGFWEHNTGRPFISYRYPPISVQKTGQVRFGLQFLEDSLINAINTFFERDQFIYPSEYGRIRGMRNTSNAQVESVGNILLILGECQSWSVYVNRATLETLDGRTQVSLSDRVLGSFNTLLGGHGTLNPESITAHNGRVTWWNAKKGVWVRYSRDGITEISKVKMSNWFKDLSMLLIDKYATSTPPKVLSTYDEYYDEWITRVDHEDLPDTFKGYSSYKCATFSERNAPEGGKRWKSIWDYAPDLFACLDNDVYSIIGSAIHIHEAGVDYSSIYGQAKASQIEFVANGMPRKVKDWKTVALIATDKWSFDRIMGDWKSNAATIQETRLPLAALQNKEGTFWSEIRRDMNSPNAASEADGVVNGNPMKGKSLRLLIKLDPSVDYLSVFNWLIVGYELSHRNPKN